MKKANRVSEPNILKNNKAKWTKNLLAEIKKQGSYTKVDSKFKNKYNQDEVKKSLKQMYHSKCCYCENNFVASSYGHIEHLKPKANSNFHHLSFEWDNLHWSCQICNMKKGEKWDDDNPIIDPTVDEPQEHIEISSITGKIVSKSDRGRTTIDHVGLNREELVEARKRIIYELNEIKQLVLSTESVVDDKLFRRLVENLVSDESAFSTLMRSYLDSWSV